MMTFDEWWDGYSADRDWPWRIRGVAHEAWHIATEAERERCAEVCFQRTEDWAEIEGSRLARDELDSAISARKCGIEATNCGSAIREQEET